MFQVSEEYRLRALLRVFLAAKFQRHPVDTDIPASPYVAELAVLARDSVMALEIESDGAAARERWAEWLAIDPQREDWWAAMAFATREFRKAWPQWDVEQRRRNIGYLLSPYALSPELLRKFDEELESAWSGHVVTAPDRSLEASLENAAEAVLVPLRVAEGLDPRAVETLKDALRAAAHAWAHANVIPKRAASLLVDLAPAIESCGFAYPGDEGKQIRDLSIEIADLIRECFAFAA